MTTSGCCLHDADKASVKHSLSEMRYHPQPLALKPNQFLRRPIITFVDEE